MVYGKNNKKTLFLNFLDLAKKETF